jgi:hypothetical protein
MVQAASLFNQLLQHFPRTEFAALVKEHAAERNDSRDKPPAEQASLSPCIIYVRGASAFNLHAERLRQRDPHRIQAAPAQHHGRRQDCSSQPGRRHFHAPSRRRTDTSCPR